MTFSLCDRPVRFLLDVLEERWQVLVVAGHVLQNARRRLHHHDWFLATLNGALRPFLLFLRALEEERPQGRRFVVRFTPHDGCAALKQGGSQGQGVSLLRHRGQSPARRRSL